MSVTSLVAQMWAPFLELDFKATVTLLCLMKKAKKTKKTVSSETKTQNPVQQMSSRAFIWMVTLRFCLTFQNWNLFIYKFTFGSEWINKLFWGGFFQKAPDLASVASSAALVEVSSMYRSQGNGRFHGFPLPHIYSYAGTICPLTRWERIIDMIQLLYYK